MSDRRFFRSIVAAVLAVILLAAAVPQAQSGPLSQALPYRVIIPVIQHIGPVIIRGTVTNNGAAASGETIRLMVSRNSGLSYTEAAQATTSANGSYQITVPVANILNDRFYAVWRNPDRSVNLGNKLWGFTCKTLAYESSSRDCSFDIRDVALVDPIPGKAINFPYTFIWSRRAYVNASTLDSYAVTIHNDDENKTLIAQSTLVGYTDRVTMPVAPPGTQTNKRYFWSVRVYTPAGVGDAFWLNAVYYNDLNSPGIDAQGGPVWLPAEGGRAGAGLRE